MRVTRPLALAGVLTGLFAAPAVATPGATVGPTKVILAADGHVLVAADVQHTTPGALTGRARIDLRDAAGHVLATGVSRARGTGTTLHHRIDVRPTDGDALRAALAADRPLHVHVRSVGAVTAAGHRRPVRMARDVIADASAVLQQVVFSALPVGTMTVSTIGESQPCFGGLYVDPESSPLVVTIDCGGGLSVQGPVPGAAFEGTFGGQDLAGAQLTGQVSTATAPPFGTVVILLPA